jgi:hypothetical protein
LALSSSSDHPVVELEAADRAVASRPDHPWFRLAAREETGTLQQNPLTPPAPDSEWGIHVLSTRFNHYSDQIYKGVKAE